MKDQQSYLYRKLPQLDELLGRPEVKRLVQTHSRELVVDAARAVLRRLRQEIRAEQQSEESLEECLRAFPQAIECEVKETLRPSLRRVINATGVILQTNLGRAPLAQQAIERISDIAGGYCNLEIDLASGERGRRDAHAESLILDLLALRTGAAIGSLDATHGAAVVNNCAAATFLVLNTAAEGGEVLVSRGELVEIGGGFRIPDILRKSGAVLREVGTTNRTRVEDYAAAISPATRLILRVHRSNFRMEGFTERADLRELIALGRTASVPVFEDQGTGCVVALEEYGIDGEASWIESATSGASIVAASGDKLLGGPQCGILTGERSAIERIRSNPLFRALRCDKLTYAALQGTLLAYLQGREATVPAIRMLRMPAVTVRERCRRYVSALANSDLQPEVVPSTSVVGGGTTPGATVPSYAVALQHRVLNDAKLASALRQLEVPIVARTNDGRVLLDLRTVAEDDDELVLGALRAMSRRSE